MNKKVFKTEMIMVNNNCGYVKIFVWEKISLVKIFRNENEKKALIKDLSRVNMLAELLIEKG